MSITDSTHPIEPSPPHTIILKSDFPPSSLDTFELIQWSSNAFLGPPSSRLYTFPSFRMILNLKLDVWWTFKTFRISKKFVSIFRSRYWNTIYLLVKKFFPHIATRFRVNQNDKMLIWHNNYKLIRKKYIDIGTFPSILVTHIYVMDLVNLRSIFNFFIRKILSDENLKLSSQSDNFFLETLLSSILIWMIINFMRRRLCK